MGIAQMDQVLYYLYRITPESAGRAEILRDVFRNQKEVPVDAILIHLEGEGLIYQSMGIDNNFVYDDRHRYALTIPGIGLFDDWSNNGKPLQARETGRLLEIENKKIAAKLAKAESWPKRHWLFMQFIAIGIGTVFGIFSTMFVEMLKHKMWPDPKPNMQIVVVHDTIRMRAKQVSKQ